MILLMWDTTGNKGGEYDIGDFQDGKWLNYTIDAAENRMYDVEIRYGIPMDWFMA